MRTDPAIAALRRDRSPQRRAQAIMAGARDEWLASPIARSAMHELELYGQGRPLPDCPALAALFENPDDALEFVDGMVRVTSGAMMGDMLGQPALRHGLADGHSTLMLGRAGRSQLTLHGSEPDVREAHSARFSDAERHEVVLGGCATGRLVRRDARSGTITFSEVDLMPGTCLSLQLGNETLQYLEVRQQMVVLRLERSHAVPGPSREYSIPDGKLVHQSAGTMRSSRQEMMLALLGRMECREAAPVMAEMACEAGDDSLRWQALRECLALDTASGFRALSDVARNVHDGLADPAGALRARLVEAFPQLKSIEDTQCHA